MENSARPSEDGSTVVLQTKEDDAMEEQSEFPKVITRTPRALIEEVKVAFYAELYIAALNLLVTIPDVCASLASPDHRSSSADYIQWASDYLGLPLKSAASFDKSKRQDKQATNRVLEALGPEQFSAADLYQLRCAVTHNASSSPDIRNSTSPYHSIGVQVMPDACHLVLQYGEQDEDAFDDSGRNIGRQSFDVVISLNALISLMDKGVKRFKQEHPEANHEQDKNVFMYRRLLDARCWGDGTASL